MISSLSRSRSYLRTQTGSFLNPALNLGSTVRVGPYRPNLSRVPPHILPVQQQRNMCMPIMLAGMYLVAADEDALGLTLMITAMFID